ncbi:MAG: hypothetical protein HQK89_07190 [Nitrospirae bacterium]|nr:hypothetical protein [Nitrospirota bacterium]
MKRSIIYVLVLALFLMGLAVYEGQYSHDASAASDNVTYRFPYFHTAAANVIYCVASNYSSASAAMSFIPRTSGGGAYTTGNFPVISAGNLAAQTTDIITVSGNSLTTLVGNTTATIAGPDSTSKGAFYSIDLAFVANNQGVTGDTLTCANILLACFQGTSTPKRNLVGYYCMQTSAAGVPTQVINNTQIPAIITY